MRDFKKIYDKIVKEELYKKVCGKISNITVSRTVGFKPENMFSIEETIYFLGFKIKQTILRNVVIKDATLIETAKKFAVTPVKPNRMVVKGFKN